MKFAVDFPQPASGDVSINFRRGDGGMAEQFLDHPQSAPFSSKWVAKLWRSMCGVTLRAMPARRTRCLIRSQSVTAANGVPRRVRKTLAGDREVTSFGRPAK